MSAFERFVRPFQTRDTSPPRAVLAADAKLQANADPVETVIGDNWQVKSVNGSETIDVSYYMERWMKEKKTET